MNPALNRIIVALAFAAANTVAPLAGAQLTVKVDLRELRGDALLHFMRAAVPEVYGGESRPPLDLATLAILHGHLVSNLHFKDREEAAWGREVQDRLERVVRAALEKTDLPTLRRITLGDGNLDYGIGHLYPALYQRWIAAEVARICSEAKLKPAFPAGGPPLPQRFRYTVVSGADAAALQRATGPFAKLLAELSKQEPRGLTAEGERFGELVRAFLMERDKNVASELLRFSWDSWCGTGLAEIEGTQITLVFMGLLREGRIAEALGASFFVPDAPVWMREPDRPFDQWRIHLLKFCGFDWEEVLVAAQHREFLAAAGSEKGARRELEALKSDWTKHGIQPWKLKDVTAFLIPGEPGHWSDADPRKSISAEIQTEILDVIKGAVHDEIGFHELDGLMDVFEELRHPETKDTLHRLLKHPSTTFADRAASVLRDFGEEIEPIAPAAPVRFRIYLNEQPWRAAELDYEMADPKVPHLGTGSLKTDTEGFATIPRDEFLDPSKRSTRIRFLHRPHSGDVESEKIYDRAWAQTEAAIPKAFDETTAVHFTACRLPIEIAYATPPPHDSAAEITLMKAGQFDPNARVFSLYFTHERVRAPSQFAFGSIEPGRYQLAVLAPGSARHVSEPFEVKAGMPSVQVKLEKGSDIYAELQVPENARGAGETELLRAGKDITDDYASRSAGEMEALYSGLPKGRYQLRILSTEEFMRKHKITDWNASEALRHIDPDDEVDCKGRVIDFAIDDATPPLLDLGPIKIKPVASTRAKGAR